MKVTYCLGLFVCSVGEWYAVHFTISPPVSVYINAQMRGLHSLSLIARGRTIINMDSFALHVHALNSVGYQWGRKERVGEYWNEKAAHKRFRKLWLPLAKWNVCVCVCLWSVLCRRQQCAALGYPLQRTLFCRVIDVFCLTNLAGRPGKCGKQGYEDDDATVHRWNAVIP